VSLFKDQRFSKELFFNADQKDQPDTETNIYKWTCSVYCKDNYVILNQRHYEADVEAQFKTYNTLFPDMDIPLAYLEEKNYAKQNQEYKKEIIKLLMYHSKFTKNLESVISIFNNHINDPKSSSAQYLSFQDCLEMVNCKSYCKSYRDIFFSTENPAGALVLIEKFISELISKKIISTILDKDKLKEFLEEYKDKILPKFFEYIDNKDQNTFVHYLKEISKSKIINISDIQPKDQETIAETIFSDNNFPITQPPAEKKIINDTAISLANSVDKILSDSNFSTNTKIAILMKFIQYLYYLLFSIQNKI
jgi:hypothetical protein